MTSEADRIEKLGVRILSRMNARDAFLLRPRDGGRSGVFTAKTRWSKPVALLSAEEVECLEERDWIVCAARGDRSVRYRITRAGRIALRRFQQRGAAAADRHRRSHQIEAEQLFQVPGEAGPRKIRVNTGESPLGWLARRKGPAGEPFLTALEIEAGERFRADFERAQLGPRVTQDWRSFLAPAAGAHGPGRPEPSLSGGAEVARKRLGDAMRILGPDVADAVLRTCCFLEGLEAVESDMGWSARSGKVVLRIGLRRLVDHYGLEARGGAGAPLRSWRNDADASRDYS